MSMPSPFLTNSFGSFCLLLVKSSATDSKKLLSVKPKLKSAIGVDAGLWTGLQFGKFQNILTSAS